MRATIVLPAFLGLLLAGGCNDLDVGDLNSPGLDQLQGSPTRTLVLTAATGLLIGTRSGQFEQNGYVAQLGIFGRESYNFDPADPRFISEMLDPGPLNGGSPAFGGNLWGSPYSNIRNANTLKHSLTLLSDTPPAGMSPAEKAATLGFTQTIQALDFLNVINTRDANGAPIAVDIPASGPPAPIASKAEVFAYIVALLDSAQTHLQAGGATFPFPVSTGFDGFNTPPTFLKFNRALRARVAVYTGDFATASTLLLTDNAETFIIHDPAQLRLGVYHVFTTQAGDSLNLLTDPTPRALYIHPSIRTGAQLQTDGVTPDRRFVEKTLPVALQVLPEGAGDISSDLANNVYTSPTSPIPIIRNEELILLRAEANIGLNNPAAAVPDIDFIRQNAGGLPPYAGAVTQAALLDELLYNKRYSLLFEGGHSWIDYRRYNKLTSLPRDLPSQRFYTKMPFPTNECLVRGATAPAQGCTNEPGF